MHLRSNGSANSNRSTGGAKPTAILSGKYSFEGVRLGLVGTDLKAFRESSNFFSSTGPTRRCPLAMVNHFLPEHLCGGSDWRRSDP